MNFSTILTFAFLFVLFIIFLKLRSKLRDWGVIKK